ncbi:MAG TPA: hypothetical protein VMN57_12640 [Anaerolineales bacterium]|nr:hypothetical protein [Anaerolineales bacterium]
MKPSLFRPLGIILLVCFLAAGAYAIARSPFAGWAPGETLPSARMLIPAAGGEVTFTFDPEDTSLTQPQAGEPVTAVSFDGDLRDLPQTGPDDKTLGIEFKPLGFTGADSGFVDPVLQESPGGGIPGPTLNFAGLDLVNWGAGWPPDTNGDIGLNHYIQTVNTSIGIYNRSGVLQSAIKFNDFFPNDGSLASCGASNKGDPIVLFDDVSGRWIITDFAWDNIQSGPYYECIAVSKTSDPIAGGWWFYALDTFDPGDPGDPTRYLNDYPKLGVWHDGIYMTTNMFDCITSNCSSASYKGVKVWALNRADMINGQPLNYQYANVGSAYFSLLPAHARGLSMPPAGTPNYLGAVHWADSNVFRTWKMTIDWNNSLNSTFTGPLDTTVAAYAHPFTVPQPAGTNLDALGGRLMAQLQYSRASGQEALWVTHSVTTLGRAGLRWYEFRNLGGGTPPTVFQQGTFSPDTTHRWMGAVGVDKTGNMAIVYSASSSSIHPQIRYAGRLVGDALGTLGQGEATLVAGTGSQTSFARWGDYAGMMLDPVDECTFWFTTEYLINTGTNWQTRIGTLSFPDCSGPELDIDTFLPIILRDR